jgi:hypothetical protein
MHKYIVVIVKDRFYSRNNGVEFINSYLHRSSLSIVKAITSYPYYTSDYPTWSCYIVYSPILIESKKIAQQLTVSLHHYITYPTITDISICYTAPVLDDNNNFSYNIGLRSTYCSGSEDHEVFSISLLTPEIKSIFDTKGDRYKYTVEKMQTFKLNELVNVYNIAAGVQCSTTT